ncbi:hypothetical protein [Dehalococcoides mccartyi]|uniref:hypothetical protein n=1 Tax=Dehalococcoides mccartyi TaxID=61435 RepID=UPI001CE686A0|nr:hypothetical protein [Dehalococcoides mccartyi]QYY58447.1 hypothetical protein CWV2_000352 [Dehalococcoides mccartyi]
MESETELGNHSTIRVEPENIYFGLLKPGNGGNVSLKVTGGPGNVVIQNDRFKVTPTNFGAEGAEIQVELQAGSAGELIWDNIVIKSQIEKIEVLVTALWEGFPASDVTASRSTATIPDAEVNETPILVKTQQWITTPRPWVGRRCTRCHKNFAYDPNTHEWEQCQCNMYQIALNMSVRIINELRYGIKDFPSFAKETWNIILGKEKW